MDDYDYDIDGLDFDDGWIYVDDDFGLADELAEGQVPNPGYSGTNYEIDGDAYEFDLFGYWDDLEYADDAYWDNGIPGKRKRGPGKENVPEKRRKLAARKVEALDAGGRDAEPLLFRSREERIRLFFRDPPLLKDAPTFALLSDWKKRFANADGVIHNKQMPASMKMAAEGQEESSEERDGIVGDGEEGDWEDEEEDGEEAGDEDDGEGGMAIDPEMLRIILNERLGATGMEEGALMEIIQKVASGEADDALEDLTKALLGKASSGSDAASNWLSQQGVSLDAEDDDDETGSAAAAETSGPSAGKTNAVQASPSDSVTGLQSKRTVQMPLHSESPAKSKKRPAAEDKASKSGKKVKFDVPSSSPAQLQEAAQDDDAATSDDPLSSEPPATKKAAAVAKTKAANATAAKANKTASSRKRKAADTDEEDKPAGKRTRSRELQSLGAVPDAPSPAPPARRTRSAKAKSGR